MQSISSEQVEHQESARIQRSGPDFELPAVLDMRAARELKASLEGLYSKGTDCIVDGHEVTRLSTGCIQILATFFHTMAGAKIDVTLRNPSAPLLDGFDQLGLSHYFEFCVLES